MFINIPIFAIILLTFCVIDVSPQCNKACTREWNPVCGRYRRPSGILTQCTFGNPCLLRVHRCKTREPWIGTPGACRRNTLGCSREVRA